MYLSNRVYWPRDKVCVCSTRGAFVPLLSRALSELAVLNEVDYLLIAKPVAVNQPKIRRDCA